MTVTGSFIRSVIAPLWAAKERSPYLKHLRTVEQMHRWPIERVRSWQLDRLRSLLLHAYHQSDFYRERLADTIGIADEMTTLDDLLRFPLLTKDDIRSNKDRMIARSFPMEKLVHKKTSGSTGVCVELYVDEDSSQWKRAVTAAFDRWAGWDIGERVGAIWGNPECYHNWRMYLRNALLHRHTYLDTLKMDEPAMLAFHSALMRKAPAILFGHAHSLFLFAQFCERKCLPKIKPNGIISTCMVLHEFERATIERVFGCRVTNRYGCEEVSLVACECRYGNMHINCDSLIVEFLRDGRHVPDGEAGALVITDLTNYGMPIIRYRVGDVAVPSSDTCGCGCSYPIIKSLEGRVADYIVTPDGNFISGISLTENFAVRLPGVKQMQIVQERIDALTFKVVKGELFSETTVHDIDCLARERFGNHVHWDIRYVDSIQSEGSGKYRFCISKVPNPFT